MAEITQLKAQNAPSTAGSYSHTVGPTNSPIRHLVSNLISRRRNIHAFSLQVHASPQGRPMHESKGLAV